MTNAEFSRMSDFVYSNFGIKLPPAKKIMLEGRLQKRLRIKNINTFTEYIDLIFGEKGDQEIIHMIDAISTNKTDFFREAGHFDFVSDEILPAYSKNNKHIPLKIWSAAASSGEEIYTIGMTISEFNKATQEKINFSILGTDISVDILRKAVTAKYHEDRIKNIPLDLKKRYFLRSKDRTKKAVRVIPELRRSAKFQRLNLIDSSYNVDSDFDIIFCRNVLIYFEKQVQEEVINKLCRHLKPGGYFFLGHSESIIGKKVPLRQLLPTVYQKI